MKGLTISSDAPGEKLFMLGNEAIARGAIEAGVQLAAAYPGTPSSEIMETLAPIAKEVGMYAEWSTNEKVAFEVGFAASLSGLRTLVTMKHVGVNVAHDPLMTAGYIGARGGFVLLAADDPWAWSSQVEQDSRFVAEQGYLPVLEPSSAAEAKDMIVSAFDLSEEFEHLFVVRSVTRIGHARSDVTLGEISKEKRKGSFKKDRARLVSTPAGARYNRPRMIKRLEEIKKRVNTLPYNQLNLVSGARLGVIASGVPYSYVKEATTWLGLNDKVSILKIGTPYPLPEELVTKLLSSVGEVLVVEELEPFVETHVKAIAQQAGIPVKIHGKDLLPVIGELSTDKVTEAIASLTGTELPANFKEIEALAQEAAQLLPLRPPALCAGCPHRASFYAIKLAAKKVVREQGIDTIPIYPGDIGCYTLGYIPPLESNDITICMGASFGLANGFAHAQDAPVIAHLGDSTFFHSGIPPLINAVYNKANITMVVLDNGTTGMTGFQPDAGTGFTATGEETTPVRPEEIARACGVQSVEVVDPFDLKATIEAMERAIRFEGPSLVVSRRPCAREAERQRKQRGEKLVPYHIDPQKCSKTSDKIMPCAATCPAGNDIPGVTNLVKQGKFQEALEIIKQTNPLPAVLGRVCYHPCETKCNRDQYDGAVAIHKIERSLGDYELTLASEEKAKVKRAEKIAIIGSGPAGLSCAYYAARMGYPVTIFEALPVAGGMLAVGIPEYRLPRDVLEKDIKRIEDLGIEIRLNTPVVSRDDLLKQGYKAVFIAVGAHKSMQLGAPGEEKEGVISALGFLRETNLGKQVNVGAKTVIIGGGNVAIDAARVALRQGAEQVSIIYRRSRAEMPASDEEIEAAGEEGVKITYLAAPTNVLGNSKVSGLGCIRMELGEPDASGRRRPIPIKGSEFTVEANTVVVAIGQAPELPFTDQLQVSPQGTLTVDASTLATNQPGIFAGGDVVTGPAMVADAIGAGRKAANSIDRYLRGETVSVAEEEKSVVSYEELSLIGIESVPRTEASKLPATERVKGFAEVESGLSPEAATSEAKRCFSCGVGSEKCIMLLGCPALLRDDNLTVIDNSMCDSCSICAQICPYNAIVQGVEK